MEKKDGATRAFVRACGRGWIKGMEKEREREERVPGKTCFASLKHGYLTDSVC